MRDIVSQETFLPALLKTPEMSDVLLAVVQKGISASGSEATASVVCLTLLDMMLSPRTPKLEVRVTRLSGRVNCHGITNFLCLDEVNVGNS